MGELTGVKNIGAVAAASTENAAGPAITAAPKQTGADVIAPTVTVTVKSDSSALGIGYKRVVFVLGIWWFCLRVIATFHTFYYLPKCSLRLLILRPRCGVVTSREIPVEAGVLDRVSALRENDLGWMDGIDWGWEAEVYHLSPKDRSAKTRIFLQLLNNPRTSKSPPDSTIDCLSLLSPKAHAMIAIAVV
ncbi:hypothetical protein V500_04530, partial [Pseudogymnoascus sp. VKM F-4518 (FW-2643)]